MVTMRFKTNLQCAHCKESVRPGLEEITEVESWEIDLDDADRILRVRATEPVWGKVLRVLQEAGLSGRFIVDV